MLTIESIMLSEAALLNGGSFVLVKAEPVQHPTEGPAGTLLTVALTGREYTKITVEVIDKIACAAFNTPEIKEITFTNFLGHFSPQPDGSHLFTATADQ
ncbi:hypothetical protein I6N95_26790, partial [Vagococcus sp. BWB3-3]